MPTPRRRARMARIKYSKVDYERFHDEPRQTGDERSPFEIDRSIIIHSAAFRRLQGKTQVFMVGQGDFYRTRLTHSLEVAQIAKGLALRLGADTDLVEAISLVHDVGHPPFGHSGERELQRLMHRYGSFEANAQNVRILTSLEKRRHSFDGLNLTRATLDGQLKYKQLSSSGKNKFIYDEDHSTLCWANIGGATPYSQSFECQIMEWADDIAYAVHDLEDGLHSGFVTAWHFADPETSHIVQQRVKSFEREAIADAWGSLVNLIKQEYRNLQVLGGITTNRRTMKADRKELTSALIRTFIRSAERVSVADKDRYESQRYQFEVRIKDDARIQTKLLTSLLRNVVFKSPQIVTLESKGTHIIRSLFLKLLSASDLPGLLPEDWRETVSDRSTRAEKARVICDYISGMTDEFAQQYYARLFLPDRGSVYELL